MSIQAFKVLRYLALGMLVPFVVFGHWGCKEPDMPPEPVIPQDTAFIAISSNVRNLLDYNVGSYFVFRDSLSGKRDSQYVIENKHYTQLGFADGKLYGRFERIRTTLENDEGVRRLLFCPTIFNTDSLFDYRYSIHLANGQGDYIYYYRFLDWQLGKRWEYDVSYEIVEHLDSMAMNNYIFHDVYVIQLGADQFYGGDTILNYYQPQIGLIKQKNPQGTKCIELVNYKILR